MQKSFQWCTLALSVFLCACSGIFENTAHTQNEGFKNLLNSVVKIDVWTKSQANGDNFTERSVGSGVIMNKEGFILTNAHVVNNYVSKLIITLPNLERVPAEFVGWDHWTDLAVIKLDTKDLKRRNLEDKFSYASFGDSSKLKAGDTVYAVGTPHGFARTVTRGIISNADRYFEGTLLNSGYETGYFNTWLQTDAAINPGNSGGPLVSPDGKVIGINTRAMIDSNNLGFSVPSNVAKKVMLALIKNPKIERAYIGINPAPLQDMETFFNIDMNQGVLVQNVDAGSPAAETGIAAGDIILKINGENADGRFPEQLPAIMNKIAEMKIGEKIELEILRAGKILKKSLNCESLESRIGKEYALEEWGVGLREITKSYARERKIKCRSNIMVIGLRQGYPFETARFQTGDIILAVNKKPVNNIKDLEMAYKDYLKNPKRSLIEVLRNHSISYLVIEPQQK